ncbi:ovomucoid [Plakobranchus ocellatus]|uniref:Ovomucoid n=1 Tax=Plakobranchus ocellatus TaxID=259542 RepID=A0AAV3Y5J1_9GAST|nr:ovomucoid [Plakobranchus ocellatus]
MASCFFRLYTGRSISVKHEGPCTADEITNPEVYKHCNDLCNEERNHICGSDGIVYDNKCTFTRAQCEAAVKNETLFIVVLSDTCPITRKPDCAKYRLDVNDLALEDPLAFRPVCPHVREMVCGSDGHSFVHECQMCAYMEAYKGT